MKVLREAFDFYIRNLAGYKIALLLFFLILSAENASAAKIYFNDVFKGTGSSYAEQTNSISNIQFITGSGFSFTSSDPADVTFKLTGNNVAGTLTYINNVGVKQTITGQVSRQDKNGSTTIGLYFYTNTSEAYLLVIPGVTSYSSTNNVSTSSDPILAVMNDVLTAQNSQPKITVDDVTVNNTDSYAVVYYTPVTNSTVYLRVYNISGSITAYAPSTSTNYSSTWATIQQIGSSAIVTPWTLSGSSTYVANGNVGIGTSSPSASAILDLTSTSKGLLPPRVALTSKTGTSSPVASPQTGLIVYNTASAGTGGDAVTPGYYYFNGAIWTRMDPEGWSSGVPITFGAPSGSTAPTKGTTTIDYVRYRNLGGKEYEVEYNYAQSVVSNNAGNGDYLISLPGGLQFDYTAPGQTAYTGATGVGAISARLTSAFGDLYHVSAHNATTAVPYDATRFRIHTNSWGTVGWTFYNYTYYQLTVTSAGFKMTFKFKAL